MHYDIIDLRYTMDFSANDLLEDAINDKNLRYNARSLREFGFESLTEISLAVERAMKVCSSNGYGVKEHFKPIYIADQDNHTILKDWRLSKLAYTLTVLNGNVDNIAVSCFQLELVKRYLKHFEEN
jgi:hypothetical protein